ncbi:MAG: hypothetical protein EOP11_10280 [Proteobacteria bacterium]|nr:MAG: hypothetical protein EOP11_10280 [Pseudomonadota bacterium]
MHPWRSMLKPSAISLLYLSLFRPRCWGCGAGLKGREDFCLACRRAFLLPMVSPGHLLRFEGPVKKLLQALRGEAYFMAARWCLVLLRRRGLISQWAEEGFTLVTVSPRARPRREDGLPLLARAIAREIGAGFAETLAKEAGYSQHGKEKGLRMNARPFLHLSENAICLRGERVLLLDDVDTTGTTLEMGAYRLRQGGASHVRTFSVARQMVESFERKSEQAQDEGKEVEPLLLHLFV